MSAALIAAQSPAPATPPWPPPVRYCPFSNPGLASSAPPRVPAAVTQHGITGTVEVHGAIDDQGHLISTKVASSPNELLDDAALDVVRHSSFYTETPGCSKPMRDFRFSTTYGAPGDLVSSYLDGFGGATILVDVPASAAAHADAAFVHLTWVAHDRDRAKAVAKADAGFHRFRDGLSAIGMSSVPVYGTYYTVGTAAGERVSPAGEGWVASHAVVAIVRRFTQIRAVLQLGTVANATTAAVGYGITVETAAADAAVRAADSTIAAEAKRVAAAHGVGLGGRPRALPALPSTEPDADVFLGGPFDRLAVPPPPAYPLRVHVRAWYGTLEPPRR